MEVIEIQSQEEWDRVVESAGGHPLQLWGWGELKASFNWQARRLLVREGGEVVGGMQLLIRPLPWPFRGVGYVPRGPFMARGAGITTVVEALTSYTRAHFRLTNLTIEPDYEEWPSIHGWRESQNTVLHAKTLVLDLEQSEEYLLSKMTKKTRQYVRKSMNSGLEIRQINSEEEIDQALTVYEQTAKRAHFGLHTREYYQAVHRNLGPNSVIWASFDGDKLVAFLWLGVSRATAFELYGGMTEEGRRLRANYALKWQAITKCREQGVKRYDLNGLLNDGISQFKEGFADHENKLTGAWAYPLSIWHGLWSVGLPIVKKLVQQTKLLFK